mgnify:FL=1
MYKWDADKNAYLAPDGTVIKNKAILYAALYGGEEGGVLTTNFINNPRFAQITDWEVASGDDGYGGDVLTITAEDFDIVKKRFSAAKKGLKARGYANDENGKAVYDWLKEKGFVAWYEAQGGQIKYDTDNKETIMVKGPGDDEWFERTGDSTGGPLFDWADLRDIFEKMGLVRGSTRNIWSTPKDVG